MTVKQGALSRTSASANVAAVSGSSESETLPTTTVRHCSPWNTQVSLCPIQGVRQHDGLTKRHAQKPPNECPRCSGNDDQWKPKQTQSVTPPLKRSRTLPRNKTSLLAWVLMKISYVSHVFRRCDLTMFSFVRNKYKSVKKWMVVEKDKSEFVFSTMYPVELRVWLRAESRIQCPVLPERPMVWTSDSWMSHL